MRARETERRRDDRQPGTTLWWVQMALIVPGREVEIVDWSPGGVRVRTAARLAPGGPVVLSLRGAGSGLRVDARILRSEVLSIDGNGRLQYACALDFRRRAPLGQVPKQPAVRGTQMGAAEARDVRHLG